jgi:hypothetical protein
VILTDANNVLETDVFKLIVHENGLVLILIKHSALYDTKDIIEGKNFITDFLGEKKAYILLELEGDAYTTREARELAASSDHSKHHGAVAISSNKLAYRILGKLYIKINKPKAPTRFFNNRTEAVHWLNSLLLS